MNKIKQMGKGELIFKIAGLASSIIFGAASLYIEYKRKFEISKEDKEDIANLVVAKITDGDNKLEKDRKFIQIGESKAVCYYDE